MERNESQGLKGHAGHHVRITAQVDNTKNVIVVKSIRLLPATHEMPSNNDYRPNILPEPFRITCDDVKFQLNEFSTCLWQ